MTDFYRLRYTDTRIMLLDFQRSADQVFDPQQTVITDDGLLLGVRDKNVTMLSNEDGSVTAFTQEGALWTYAPDTGKFVDIFAVSYTHLDVYKRQHLTISTKSYEPYKTRRDFIHPALFYIKRNINNI